QGHDRTAPTAVRDERDPPAAHLPDRTAHAHVGPQMQRQPATLGPAEAIGERQLSLLGSGEVLRDRPRLFLLMVGELPLEVLEDPLESHGPTVGARPRDGPGVTAPPQHCGVHMTPHAHCETDHRRLVCLYSDRVTSNFSQPHLNAWSRQLRGPSTVPLADPCAMTTLRLRPVPGP